MLHLGGPFGVTGKMSHKETSRLTNMRGISRTDRGLTEFPMS